MREYGLAHSEPFTVYWAVVGPQTSGVLATPPGKGQEANIESPEEINRNFREQRANQFLGYHYVVIGGSYEFAAPYKATLTEPDVVIYCSDESVLRQLAVEILDAGWHEGRPRVNLTDVFFGEGSQSPSSRDNGTTESDPDGV